MDTTSRPTADERALLTELTNAVSDLWCIHGWRPVIRLNDPNCPTVVVKCYECRQTMSLPPGFNVAFVEALQRNGISDYELKFPFDE